MRIVPSAYVELYKRDPESGKQTLVHTSRPCPGCRQPLDGRELVVPGPTGQVHARCRARVGIARRMNG